jgi:hypothetical protein
LSKSTTPSKCGHKDSNPKQGSPKSYPQAKFDPNSKQKSNSKKPLQNAALPKQIRISISPQANLVACLGL